VLEKPRRVGEWGRKRSGNLPEVKSHGIVGQHFVSGKWCILMWNSVTSVTRKPDVAVYGCCKQDLSDVQTDKDAIVNL